MPYNKIHVGNQNVIKWGGSLFLFSLLFFSNLVIGSTSLSLSQIFDALFNQGTPDVVTHFIVVETRLPAAATATLAGGSLAVIGLLLQASFHNPLADPGLLGVSGGASLGAAICILLIGINYSSAEAAIGFSVTILSAFIGAIIVTLLLFLCNKLFKNSLILLLFGVMLSYTLNAIVTMLNFQASADNLRSFFSWQMGDFSSLTLSDLPIFALLSFAGCLLALTQTKPLNLLRMGDDYARNAGIHARSFRAITLLVAGLLTATVTAFCGPIAYIGLVTPHFTRILFHTSDYRSLLPLSMLWGGNIALLCNLISSLPGANGLIPINTTSSILSLPFLILLLLRWSKK
ncbi:iron ABC transporter permease [Alloprevotella tannerae]|jgi:iron compound ABC transporter, permease protein|uniref:FecCD family ABC transporter permease n=1 Tax=Alloprevotella tannerae TaxID=76122 RepID=UPI001EDA13B9|nr:iron ABC transporter permease [Alloprevotella tannerae]MCG2648861.1 iron ABC transporter permease [Alloprevotella tannerae]